MQVILREDVAGLGRAGDLVTVKDGYGRNYLLPRRLAVPATTRNVAQVEHERRAASARVARLARDARSLADRIGAATVTIARRRGEGDRIFGSVTGRDVAEALAEAGIALDHRKVELAEPIRSLGMYRVPVRVAREASAEAKVWVVAKE